MNPLLTGERMYVKGRDTMRNITVSYRQEKGQLNRYFSHCIGAGRANELLRFTAMEQLEEAVKKCGFRYIRFHGIFHEDMGVCTRDEDGRLHYNFQYIDLLFDRLLKIGIRPFLELSFMPKCMASGSQTVFFWTANVTPPVDYTEWTDFITAFVTHLTLRYGEEEIKQWYFEVWNEPNHKDFFSEHAHIEAYYMLYAKTAFAVKKVNPAYRVGGPATAGMSWIEEFQQFCKRTKTPLDFISSHSYCVAGHFDPDGKKYTALQESDALIKPIKKYGKLVENAGLPLCITEWSTSYSSRDPIHDSYISAPFILHAIKELDGYADSFSYWVFTDIFEETGLPPTPFHGGFGLFNTQSLKKSVFHSYQFLNELGDIQLECKDEDCYACKSQDEVQILAWNYTRLDQHDEGNRTFYARLLPSTPAESVQICLTDLTPGSYTVCRQTVGYCQGDVYSAYLQDNAGDLVSIEQTERLRKASEPSKEEFTIRTDDTGVLTINYSTNTNQVDFIKIRKKLCNE